MAEKYDSNKHAAWLKANQEWAEFKTRSQILKDEGMSPRDANQKSFEESVQRVEQRSGNTGAALAGAQSISTLPDLPEVAEMEAVWGDFRGKKQDAKEAIDWAMANLNINNPKKCPSATAWSLLAWGRKSRTEFMKMWAQYQPKPSEADLKSADIEDEQAIALLEAFDAGTGTEDAEGEHPVPAESAEGGAG